MESFIVVGVPSDNAQIIGHKRRQLALDNSSIATNDVLFAGIRVVVLNNDLNNNNN
jgi:hypothetical protein